MTDESSNPYTAIIVAEALRRGIDVELIDDDGEMVLSHDGRRIRCLQSLTELTSALTYLDCDDKWRSRQVLARASLPVPDGRLATFDDADLTFVRRHGRVVVKPARGEGGQGITVGVGPDELDAALETAHRVARRVLLEERCPGDDVRMLVIGDELVAAAVRRPPTVVGDGRRTVAELVAELDELRRSDTDGVARVPYDGATAEHVRREGHDADDVLADGERLRVRGTANLHTGGTIDDLTADVHPAWVATALAAARAVRAPVAGVDLMVPDLGAADHVTIEVNEQPGLANHEPHPTAERFVDLLFPATAAARPPT